LLTEDIRLQELLRNFFYQSVSLEFYYINTYILFWLNLLG
jgi:hypothetical protein